MPRTMGQTKDCGGCRYWSEMVARSIGGGPVEALCLCDGGPLQGKYTTERRTCSAWASGHLGAWDDPPNYGEETRAAYAREEERKQRRKA